ncbi:MAG: LolA family protein [Hyphomicrobiales bacterium]
MITRRLLLFVLASVLGAAEASAVDVQTIVRKVQERYDSTRDFTAHVTQETTVASLGKTTTAEGTVAFKKPGKMRWELDHNAPQLIVADGSTLWLYQQKERQVIKAPFDAAFRSSTPISFLTGVGRLAQDFDASVDGTSPDGQLVSLLLIPRRDSAAVGKLRLHVAADSGEIRGAEIFDPLGNVSRLQFADIKRNQNLPDKDFVFELPPGVDVIIPPALQ